MAKKAGAGFLKLLPAAGLIAPPPPNNQPLTPLSAEEITAIANFERALGGRLRLTEAIAAAPTLPEELSEVLVYLSDPRFRKTSLAEICQTLRIRPGQLFAAFKDAVVAKANLLAIDQVASALPTIVATMIDQAKAAEDPCDRCNGVGMIQDDPTEKIPEPKPRRCPECNGVGFFRRRGDLDTQKVLLEATGLISKPGMTVGLTNNILNVPASGGSDRLGGLEQLQQAVAAAMYAPTAPAAVSTVEAEIIPPVTEDPCDAPA